MSRTQWQHHEFCPDTWRSSVWGFRWQDNHWETQSRKQAIPESLPLVIIVMCLCHLDECSNEDTIDTLAMFLDGSFCNDWIFLLPSRNATETQDADHCITTCLKLWAGYYILIIDHCWELIEVSEEWWQLVTAVHNEGNSLNAFWVAFVVLWLHSFLSCLLWFCLIWHNNYVQKKCYNILLLNIFTAWNHTYGKGLIWVHRWLLWHKRHLRL